MKRRNEREYQEYQRKVALSGIDEIDRMTGEEFEERMKVHFELLGYEVMRTRGSHDYGADLILTDKAGRRVVVQLKRYNAAVGVSAVQEVVAAVKMYNANQGALVTNNYLTKNAKMLAQKCGIVFWERDRLIESLAQVKARLYQGEMHAERHGPPV